MFSDNNHIRCCASCQPAEDSALSELLLAKCGRCLFHRGCLPENCKCGRPAHPAVRVGINGCFSRGCRETPRGWRIVCNTCNESIVEKTIARIKLMGSLHHTALLSFFSYFPGMFMEGDVLQIVAEQVIRALHKSWQVFCLGDGRYVYFTDFIAELAKSLAFHPKKMCDELELPEAAVAELTRCGRSRVNGWLLQGDGLLRHASKSSTHVPTCANELYEFLSSPSRPTFPTAEAVAFYPNAPGDLVRLIEQKKLVYLEHYKFVARPPEISTANVKLRDYWMEHVAPGLKDSLEAGVP